MPARRCPAGRDPAGRRRAGGAPSAERGRAVGRLLDPIAARAELADQRAARLAVVLDDQDAWAGRSRALTPAGASRGERGAARGRSTSIARPPSCWGARRRGRPSPRRGRGRPRGRSRSPADPPGARARDRTSRTGAAEASGTPGPASSTVSRTTARRAGAPTRSGSAARAARTSARCRRRSSAPRRGTRGRPSTGARSPRRSRAVGRRGAAASRSSVGRPGRRARRRRGRRGAPRPRSGLRSSRFVTMRSRYSTSRSIAAALARRSASDVAFRPERPGRGPDRGERRPQVVRDRLEQRRLQGVALARDLRLGLRGEPIVGQDWPSWSAVLARRRRSPCHRAFRHARRRLPRSNRSGRRRGPR